MQNSTGARPKPWWQDHPELKAIVAQTLAELESLPERTTPRTAAERRVLDEYFGEPSTDDDASTDDDVQNSTGARPKPWWQDHPELKAIVAQTLAEIDSLPDRPPIDYPDPVLEDVFTGQSIRELRDARDDLARAKGRYDDAVLTARRLCLSWGQIGAVLGVSRQQLHRRYRDAAD
ncbi:hypothetical protein ACTWP6_28150 [Mycobacterium sp. 4D054]|uniref:hypothetical protein n=1 Tax=unclassified Mycobacterium TaxID=2642494 RepID=UPI0021B1CB6D|nr:hypothetical protein [Mycobacterium sp. SMC-8]